MHKYTVDVQVYSRCTSIQYLYAVIMNDYNEYIHIYATCVTGIGNAKEDEVVFHGDDTKFVTFYIR